MAAQTIGVVSGVSTLITTALQGGLILEKAIKSYDGHERIVRDFLTELVALIQILNKLGETVKAIRGVDFSMLEAPLRQCANTCVALHEELQECFSRSNDSHTSFRDWVRLKYMGEDIDGIRRLLAEYKMTITIALADANLHESAVTVEKIESCSKLVTTTKADLQGRLERIDEKIELVIGQNKGDSENLSELKLIEEERLSTERCLQICTRLSDHISHLQFTAMQSNGPNRPLNLSTHRQKVVDEGFQGCVNSLSRTTSRLEEHEKQLFDRLIDRTKAASFSDKDQTDLEQLRYDWIAARHSLSICSTTESHLREKISVIENYAKGNAIQIMASNGEKILHGKNTGLGEKVGQVGGHVSDDTIQQSLRIMASIFGSTAGLNESSVRKETVSEPVDDAVENGGSSFKGKGFQLASNSPSCTYTMSTTNGKDDHIPDALG